MHEDDNSFASPKLKLTLTELGAEMGENSWNLIFTDELGGQNPSLLFDYYRMFSNLCLFGITWSSHARIYCKRKECRDLKQEWKLV
jgi:hypothetical protein